MWTNGANTTNGAENWLADTEIDAVETQYGASYVSVHYGSPRRTATAPETGPRTEGMGRRGAIYATPDSGVPNIRPGWNVVDIEFTSTVANVYFNGKLYITIPASVLSHKPPISTSESPGRTVTTRTTRSGQQDTEQKMSST